MTLELPATSVTITQIQSNGPDPAVLPQTLRQAMTGTNSAVLADARRIKFHPRRVCCRIVLVLLCFTYTVSASHAQWGITQTIVQSGPGGVPGVAGANFSSLGLAGLGGLVLLLVALRRRRLTLAASLAACVALLASALPASATPVTIDWVPVGNAGNAADPNTGSLYGAVAYNYSIDKYDVTVGQYTEFLNAVAATDTYGLYSPSMASNLNIAGISRSGSSGSYAYSVIGSSANLPITYVNWGGAARFSNWLQNGQPTGAEGAGTTETGAYTLNGATSNAALNAITRNADATVFIPSESEWYKAAYYDPTLNSGAGGYYQYPFSSNTVPTSAVPGSTPNTGNLYDSTTGYAVTHSTSYSSSQNYLTAVGTYTASAGPYGAYDMGGDVWQWNETLISGSYRGLRGGSWLDYSSSLQSSYRIINFPTGENSIFGFRVASVPEPSTFVLAACGAVGLLWLAGRRRLKPRQFQRLTWPRQVLCAATSVTAVALFSAPAAATTITYSIVDLGIAELPGIQNGISVSRGYGINEDGEVAGTGWFVSRSFFLVASERHDRNRDGQCHLCAWNRRLRPGCRHSRWGSLYLGCLLGIATHRQAAG